MMPTRTYEKSIDQTASVAIPENGCVVIVSDMFETYPVCYNTSAGNIPIKMKEGYTHTSFTVSTNGKSVVVKDLGKRLKMLYVMEYNGGA